MFYIIMGFIFLSYSILSFVEVANSIFKLKSSSVALEYILFSTNTIHTIGFVAITFAAGVYIAQQGKKQMKEEKNQKNSK